MRDLWRFMGQPHHLQSLADLSRRTGCPKCFINLLPICLGALDVLNVLCFKMFFWKQDRLKVPPVALPLNGVLVFKFFLFLPVCVVSFLFLAAPPLNAGFSPKKSADLSIKSLKSENPELWETLGLDILGSDETVLSLADHSDLILRDTLREVISSLPPAQTSCNDVNALVAPAGNNEGQQTQTPLTAPENNLEPVFSNYPQTRNYIQTAVGYFGRLLEEWSPSLFYNPMELTRLAPAIDPGNFPARWLQIREIRDYLWQKWIRLDSHQFRSRIRRFDNLRLPAGLCWLKKLIQGFSFQGAVIPRHTFVNCQLIDSNLKGTQLYRCGISFSEMSNIETDQQTQLQTSIVQINATQDTIEKLLAVPRAINRDDSSWQGLVERMINIYFVSQLQQHTLLQQMIVAVSSGQVSEFIEHSRKLIDSYPELFSVALQVMFIVSLQDQKMEQYRPRIQLLMSHHAAEALELISARNQPGIAGNIEAMMEQILWSRRTDTLSAEQLNYQHNLMDYMQQHGLEPVTIPKDDQCFYHVLAQHAVTGDKYLPEDNARRAERLRLIIASYLFVYLVNHHYAPDDLSPGLPVDDVMETKMSFLDNVLSEGAIDLTELLNTAAEAASSSGWAGQTTGFIAAIVLGQPAFMVNDHGSNVHVSLVYPDGTPVSGDKAQQALESGQIQHVIPLVFDSVNHWFTMTGAMLQTRVVLHLSCEYRSR